MDFSLFDTSVLLFDRLALALLFAAGIARAWLHHSYSQSLVTTTSQRFIDVSIIILILSTGLVLLSRTAALADVPLLETFPYLTKVITHSHYGTTWTGRIFIILLIGVLWFFGRKKGLGFRFHSLLITLTIGIAFFISGASHAGEGGLWTFENVNNTLHILATSLWGGSVIVFLVFLRKFAVEQHPYSNMAHRLTSLATIALIGVILTGVVNAYFRLDSLNVLWDSDYGLTLMLKLLFVIGMMGIGALNRFMLIPKLALAEEQFPEKSAQPQSNFRRALSVDTLIYIVIMLIAVLLATMSPEFP